MVSLKNILSSNSRISSDLPKGLVAIFVGGTSGIGEYTLKCFAKRTSSPRVYIIGRSQSAANRIVSECKALNPDGTFEFIRADVGLLKEVDDVCRQIRRKEESVNILFMTQGSLAAKYTTTEDLQLDTSLHYHGRMRFISNLLPQLKNAPHLRRVVSVFGATNEGAIHTEDFQARNLGFIPRRDHVSAMITLGLEEMARQAPSITFIHEFPGLVQTQAVDAWPGALGVIVRFVVFVAGRAPCLLATSSHYPPASGSSDVSGVSAGDEKPAIGTAGATGGGVYSLAWDGEAGGSKSQEALAKLRVAGMDEMLRKHTEGEFKRITGSLSI
ncbi:uncharacterized protein N7443_002038 [Penicillium atrosanguineum]|uniref:uncharacterized protein n=1 Tax=Penicillium atrosanguineum TaxID=1132637 RepID=UPI0023A70152|nr:uncharacterized protein N7443_002038 [Penicillium atrosanguineum]KAJ5309577.1 hypothetical protein N7443_002038 [Penicillium atrosanguineum]